MHGMSHHAPDKHVKIAQYSYVVIMILIRMDGQSGQRGQMRAYRCRLLYQTQTHGGEQYHDSDGGGGARPECRKDARMVHGAWCIIYAGS